MSRSSDPLESAMILFFFFLNLSVDQHLNSNEFDQMSSKSQCVAFVEEAEEGKHEDAVYSKDDIIF